MKHMFRVNVLLCALALSMAGDVALSDTTHPAAGNNSIVAPGVQDLLDSAVASGRISAAVAMLGIDGKAAWLGTAGEMAPGIAMRSDPILPLASVGKMFTATAAMILYEQGVISLDDPVSEYIPEFANARVEVIDDAGAIRFEETATPITIYHLLTHTAGLTVTGDEFWAIWDAHVGKTNTTTFSRDLVSLPLHSQPGSRFRYGQTGAAYEVLGAVIEIASGQTLEDFMFENIFQPLELQDTYFYLPDSKADRLPEVYRRVDETLELDRAYGEDFSRSTFFHGGGGVRSAPADILRFARLFCEGGSVGGVRILEETTVAMMMSDQLGELAPDRWKPRGLSWGFGAAVKYSPGDDRSGLPNQYGWVGGGFARLWVEPKRQFIAYINFPLTPPGDNELLREFEDRVNAIH